MARLSLRIDLGPGHRLGPGKVDRQKAVGEVRALDPHALSQEERALELARCNAPMQENPVFVFVLAPTDEELALLKRDLQLVQCESSNGERYPQTLRMRQILGQTLNVVGRIAVGRGSGHPIKRSFDFIKAEKKRRVQVWCARHKAKPSKRRLGMGPVKHPAA